MISKRIVIKSLKNREKDFKKIIKKCKKSVKNKNKKKKSQENYSQL